MILMKEMAHLVKIRGSYLKWRKKWWNEYLLHIKHVTHNYHFSNALHCRKCLALLQKRLKFKHYCKSSSLSKFICTRVFDTSILFHFTTLINVNGSTLWQNVIVSIMKLVENHQFPCYGSWITSKQRMIIVLQLVNHMMVTLMLSWIACQT